MRLENGGAGGDDDADLLGPERLDDPSPLQGRLNVRLGPGLADPGHAAPHNRPLPRKEERESPCHQERVQHFHDSDLRFDSHRQLARRTLASNCPLLTLGLAAEALDFHLISTSFPPHRDRHVSFIISCLLARHCQTASSNETKKQKSPFGRLSISLLPRLYWKDS
jgi:hypothetical protein